MKKQLKDMKTLFLLSACLLMAACTGRSSQASNDDEAKPVITVTLEPQRYFTEAIARRYCYVRGHGRGHHC